MGSAPLLTAALTAMLAAPAATQVHGFEVLLRDGTVVAVASIAGSSDAGFEFRIGSRTRAVAGSDVLAIFGPAASEANLCSVWLQGGDLVFGDLVGGDAGGNHLELQSPVLGRVRIAVDRVQALASPGATSPLRLRLPDGVNEGLFLKATVGFDTVAGTLHQFGEAGVRFQPDGAAPRWYGRNEFVVLRLREAVPATAAGSAARLLTRTGDRVALRARHWQGTGLQGQLEDGTTITVRGSDVASLVPPGDAIHLSDLVPMACVERGFDGDAVYTLQNDRNVLGGPLVSAGRAYAKGLGVHAQSRVSFLVPANSERFWTRVGYDDSAAGLRLQPRCDVRVSVGDKVVFTQRDLAPGQTPAATGLIAVRPGDVVTLEVDAGAGRDLGDRVNWLSPVFLPAPNRP